MRQTLEYQHSAAVLNPIIQPGAPRNKAGSVILNGRLGFAIGEDLGSLVYAVDSG